MRTMWVGLAVSVAVLSACAGMDFASPEEDARAKALEPDAQHALIYAYRRAGSANPNASALLFVRPLAPIGTPDAPEAKRLSLAEDTYWVAEVPEGSVRLTVMATLSAPGVIDTGSDHTILKVMGGQKVYVEVRTNSLALVVARRSDPRLFVRSTAEGVEALNHVRLIGILRFAPLPAARGKG